MSYDAARGWAKREILAEKEFVIFPMHENLHWSLVCFVKPGVVGQLAVKCVRGEDVGSEEYVGSVISLDSIQGYHKTKTFIDNLLHFMWGEWLHKSAADYDLTAAEVPKVERIFKSMKRVKLQVNLYLDVHVYNSESSNI